LEAWRKPKNDFKTDPSLSAVYQVAEILGWSKQQVKNDMDMDEFWEWTVYLNSPFSRRTREALLHAWLVNTIRSMVAPKGKQPKLVDSMFPFHKSIEGFMKPTEAETLAAQPNSKGQKRPAVKAASEHRIWELRKRYDKAVADYNAGRKPNSYGLYRGETIKRMDAYRKREV